LTGHDDTDASGRPRPLSSKDWRFIAVTIALLIAGGYVVWQLLGIWNAKDAVPPSWLISPPAGSTMMGEPWTDHQPSKATLYMAVCPPEGQKPHQLIEQMGLSEQPTQIGPTPLDWRPVWVYSRPEQDCVELRLVYVRDSEDTITP
jgi:hypothetical protein